MKDVIADGLNAIKTHKRAGKNECVVKPTSKLFLEVLRILKEKNYIQDYEVNEDGRGGSVLIKGIGNVNNCGAIKPRFAVEASEWYKWEQRYVLSKEFGHLIVSTSQGVMTNEEAREKGIGGRLIAFVY